MDEKHTYTSDDKLKWWGYGEWVEEPDEVSFEHAGFKCQVLRSTIVEPDVIEIHVFGGFFCGYVILTKDHPWFGKDMSDIDADVHGGVTFSEGNENTWIIGFDCAHSSDITPSMIKWDKAIREELQEKHPDLKESIIFKQKYRNCKWVIEECKSLAEEAKVACNEIRF